MHFEALGEVRTDMHAGRHYGHKNLVPPGNQAKTPPKAVIKLLAALTQVPARNTRCHRAIFSLL